MMFTAPRASFMNGLASIGRSAVSTGAAMLISLKDNKAASITSIHDFMAVSPVKG
jgi:hypothetical protein